MEYVPKKDLKPKKDLFNESIKFVRDNLKDYSFSYRLVGSAKRNLVLNHHNKGFDLDYQIIFYYSIQGQDLKTIKTDFMNTFDDFFVPRGYEHAEDSTSAITIKYLEGEKIDHSYDIVLISPEDAGLHIIKYKDDGKKELYLAQIKNSNTFNANYKKIKGNDMWADLRKTYKQKKEKNCQEKKSFSLLIESVNEVLQRN